MNKKAQSAITGATLALAMAGLTSTAQAAPAGSSSASTDLVHCYGVNVCKGHNDCKTKDNACGGHASCKGTGFVAMPSKSCKDVGGSLEDKWKGTVAKADLVKCYGVNICKGHNDCKTDKNACGGHASCKGTGFVMAPAKSCADIGGKKG
ncbi:hypothetical protein JQC92_20965 [Shewanella sp. 202IG2-18]|uniref:BufA2 family periplasmic bufferin-type metallophore n=1 Tax=Parashewanella hymeniacidonis TaxID=2807618 RepID=UPI00195FC444|nr:hypothetical protein [Parashewanella hymeniacidonis]MBM7074462.1 hypothetical protein [Parashewanella hymeniacidonis]